MARKKQNELEARNIKVDEIHNHEISFEEKRGYWRTYVDGDDGRKQLHSKTQQGLYDKLYEHYFTNQGQHVPKTLGQAISAFNDWKQYDCGKSQGTHEKIAYNARFYNGIADEPIKSLNADDLRRYILGNVKQAQTDGRSYKKSYIKGVIQVLHGTYRWSVEHEVVSLDPSYTIQAADFFTYCTDTGTRSEDDEQDEDAVVFTPEEFEQIRSHMEQQSPNMHAYAVRLAMLTAMRVGELVALHWSDVYDTYIFIHRQQRNNIVDGKREGFEELRFTKNKRGKTSSGRRFPIGPELRKLLEELREITGNETYVLSQDGHWLQKSSCNAYLRKHLKKMGLNHIGNFHAIRKTFNSMYLMDCDLTPVERSLILGHSPEVNERYYSHARNDLIDDIGRRMYARQQTGRRLTMVNQG